MTKWPTAKTLHVMALPRPGEQDLGWPGTQRENPAVANRASALLRIAAVNVGRTHTALGAFYRRLASRIGKAKAVTATARKLGVLFYNSLRFGMRYVDPGQASYEERYRTRVLANLTRRAKQLGYTLVKSPESEPVGVS
jgi:transposase